MALIQKLKISDQMTFGQISDAALSGVLQERGSSRRIDVVFDVYNEISIRSAEWPQRVQVRRIGHIQESHRWAKDKTV